MLQTGTRAYTHTQVHHEVVLAVTQGIEAFGFGCQGVIESPLKGDKGGNTEFLAHYVRCVLLQSVAGPAPHLVQRVPHYPRHPAQGGYQSRLISR